ncbi:MAG: DNA polymerase III subunit delta [Fimbriimonadaceae bacterium]|jgi:DNA polymerase-3 subunit delta|nr:DNA polymerase III subunit delta [Fimbriimonadaceae bacterium]
MDKKVILIAGDDSSGRRKGLSDLLQTWGVSPDDLDFESCIASEREPSSWIASAQQIPFLADSRVVVVRNVGRLDPEKFTFNLAEVPESGRIILVGDDEIGDESRTATIESNITKWGKKVSKFGAVVRFDLPKKSLSSDALRDKALEFGKKMSPAAAALLAEMKSDHPGDAYAEVEKLALYVGEAPAITEKDIRDTVSPDQEYNVFQLVDAIVAGQSATALGLLKLMLSKSNKVQEQAFGKLFPLISRHFRLLWQARLILDEGASFSNLSQAVKDQLPAKSIADEKDWSQRRFIQAAKKVNYQKLSRAMDLLVEADAQLKGQKPSYTPVETLETMLLRMTQVFKS